ncbi:MAG: hypothetical protein JSW23_06610 [Planctomycetota bacterium]|nr:MAG: hypothetical protein JSW23_06610 [Planctomycetota bacterium]
MSAEKQRMWFVLSAVLMTALLASISLAAEESEPKPVTLEGFVNVWRDANDVIISVQLDTDEEIYEVVLDEKGIELGEELEDEEVEVKGVVSEEDEQKWLKVLTYKVIEEEYE